MDKNSALRLLLFMAPETLPRLEAITIDGTVLAFTVCISLAAGVFFGLFPVFKYTKPNVVGALKEGGRTSSDGRERQRARGALVIAQISLALILLVGSGLMVRSFQALREVHPGFVRPSEVLTFRVSIPEVTLVGLSSSITLDGRDSNDPVFVEEFPVAALLIGAVGLYGVISYGSRSELARSEYAWRSARKGGT